MKTFIKAVKTFIKAVKTFIKAVKTFYGCESIAIAIQAIAVAFIAKHGFGFKCLLDKERNNTNHQNKWYKQISNPAKT